MAQSEPLTVGWNYANTQKTETPTIHRFMLSGITDEEHKKLLMQQLESLGGEVSTLASYDPACTHLITLQPSRNEKILSCMAAGKWILHAKYVDACVAKNEFVDVSFTNLRYLKKILKQKKIFRKNLTSLVIQSFEKNYRKPITVL